MADKKLEDKLFPVAVALNMAPVTGAIVGSKFMDSTLVGAPLGYTSVLLAQGAASAYATSFVTDNPYLIGASAIAGMAASPMSAAAAVLYGMFR